MQIGGPLKALSAYSDFNATPQLAAVARVADRHWQNSFSLDKDAVLAESSRGLGGGDILNVCVNPIYAGSVDDDPAKLKVTQALLEWEVATVKRAVALCKV